MKKSTIYIISAVLIVIALAVLARSTGVIGGKSGPLVDTSLVKRRTLSEYTFASGSLYPIKELQIASDVPGEVTAVFVKEGDSVTAGQLLAKIRPDNFINALDRQQAALEQARAQKMRAQSGLTSAKATFSATKQDYLRKKKLFESQSISEADFQAAEARYRVDQQGVESAKQQLISSQHFLNSVQASLEEAKENLRLTSLLSPIKGHITRQLVKSGERVVGTSQMAGTVMFHIGDLSEMDIHADVTENDVVRIHLGDSASVTVESFSEQPIKGIVTSIATSARVKQSIEAVTEYEVKVSLLRSTYEDLIQKTGKSNPLLPGMTANVEILTAKRAQVLSLVPSAVSLEREPSEGEGDKRPKQTESKPQQRDKRQEIVFVYQDGRAHLRKVKTGITTIDYIEILQGLDEGESVISGPFLLVSKTLEDQQEVKIRDKKKKRSRAGKGRRNR